MSNSALPLKKLEILPRIYKAYMWADYIELLCLANVDGQLSKADLLDRVRERAEDLSEGSDELRDDEDVASFERNDKWSQRSSDWFKHLEYREATFAEFYPFSVSDHGSVLNLKTPLSMENKLYLFFLFASNLRHFSKQQGSAITSIFEVASLYALRTYLPEGSKSHMFGTHPLNKDRYTGTKWDKICKLASDIGGEIVCKETDFGPNDTGDGGLDIVAWHHFLEITRDVIDKARGCLIFFGQCKCDQDWVDAQAETSDDRWGKRILFTVPPVRLTFIPFCFRGTDGGWYNNDDVHRTILVDRLRLTQLLREKCSSLEQYFNEQVNPVLKYHEPIN